MLSSCEADGSVGGDLRYVWRRMTGPGETPAAPRAVRRKIREVKLEGSPGIGRWRLLRLLRLRPGDAIDRVRVTGVYGGISQVAYITRSGPSVVRVWRADDPAPYRAEAAGHQARIRQIGDAHCDVDALGDEIDDAVVELQVDRNLGVGGKEGGQCRRYATHAT